MHFLYCVVYSLSIYDLLYSGVTVFVAPLELGMLRRICYRRSEFGVE